MELESGPSGAMAVEGSEEPQGSWALQLLSESAFLHGGVMQGARATFNAFERDLRAEEKRIQAERLRLADGWHKLEVTAKLGRRQKDATQEAREKVAREAKEVLAGAIRDTEEAARQLREAERTEEALEVEVATKRQELRQQEEAMKAREARLAPLDAERTKQADDLTAREALLAPREVEIAKNEEAMASRKRNAETFEA